MQALFRYAIHVHHQRAQLPAPQFAAQVARIAKLCDWLLTRPVTQPEALRLQKRYRKHRQHLFVFLERTDVAPTNNVSERALRASVVHRKVSGGFFARNGSRGLCRTRVDHRYGGPQGYQGFRGPADPPGATGTPSSRTPVSRYYNETHEVVR